jgi:hypothetical protein
MIRMRWAAMHREFYTKSAQSAGLEPLSYSDFTALRKAERSNFRVHRKVINFYGRFN